MPSTTTSTFFYTYVLESLFDRARYVGFTNDLRRRMNERLTKKVFSTSYRQPVRLVYYEACLSENDALRRERYLKTTGGRRFLAKRLRSFISKV
ncbi:GIY-YIG nuclease family protein [Candidatus Uhrbacteria bacterium]|nr:GIY-YIG nuclease family protein [Candidatus Uhrbacteria bacterium]